MTDSSVSIRPPLPADLDWMEVVDDLSGWRGAGVGTMQGQVRSDRWTNVLFHRVIEAGVEERVGYTTAYNYDGRVGIAWFAVATLPSAPRGLGTIGCALAIDEAFANWPIRRVLFEASESRTVPYLSLFALDIVERYGSLKDLLTPHDGRSGDRLLFGIPRATWIDTLSPLLQRFHKARAG